MRRVMLYMHISLRPRNYDFAVTAMTSTTRQKHLRNSTAGIRSLLQLDAYYITPGPLIHGGSTTSKH